ncbi:MAG TPA: PIG-L family deacetylase [Pirellulales bacterium]|nr:PIG-L family deacetylase [Pirellulales bacterium]
MKHACPTKLLLVCLVSVASLQPLAIPQIGPQARAADADKSADLAPADDGKLRILCFGAHPDDCELRVAGTAALWSAAGHHVKFVSVTNGDIGHWREAGGPLAQRRKSEVARADALLHVTSEVLDIHDGELLPTLENRRSITRLIRQWKADVVMTHRPNDYHPDHRYTGILVQDAAYMVTVPYFCPDTPCLQQNPVFLFYPDRFQKPNPFQPDVAIAIDSVMETKLAALSIMESQFYEGGANGSADLVSDDPQKQAERRRQVREGFAARSRDIATRYRAKLAEWYGDEAAAKIEFAEAFELCEYGRQPSKDELRKLFPFPQAR